VGDLNRKPRSRKTGDSKNWRCSRRIPRRRVRGNQYAIADESVGSETGASGQYAGGSVEAFHLLQTA